MSKGWSKRNTGGFWSTASIMAAGDDFRLTAQEYRSTVDVFLTRKDMQGLRNYLNEVLEGA